MTKYRAIVSIEFDDGDLAELSDEVGGSDIDPFEFINGELDNLYYGSGWVEQLFEDGNPTITRMSGGIQVEVNPHD